MKKDILFVMLVLIIAHIALAGDFSSTLEPATLITAEIYEPIDVNHDGRIISASLDQTIIWNFISSSMLDTASISVEVSGVTYTLADAELMLLGTMLIMTPPYPPGGRDSCGYCLMTACDTAGNCLESPVCGWLTMDLWSPLFNDAIPAPSSSTPDTGITISISAYDSVCGEVAIDSLRIRSSDSGIDTVVNSGEFAPTGLVDGDTVWVHAYAHDGCNDYYASNADDFSWRFHINEPGVISAEVISPIDVNGDSRVITSCTDQPIIWHFLDSPVLDITSVEVEACGETYTFMDIELTLSGDTLTLTPSTPGSDSDSCEFCLTAACDIGGDCLDTIVCGDIIIDISPPVFSNLSPEPGCTIAFTAPLICAQIIDYISAVNEEAIVFTVNGSPFTLGDTGIYWEDSTLCFDPAIAGISWTGGDTVEVCISAGDAIDYCEPNVADTCWWFAIAEGGPVAEIVRPFDEAFTSCEDEYIIMVIEDDDGIDWESIVFLVNAVSYDAGCPELLWSVAGTLYFYPSLPFSDGDTIECCLLGAWDSLGNPLEEIVCWEFYMDMSYPVLYEATPPDGSLESTNRPVISFRLYDDISGLDPESVRIILNSVAYYSDCYSYIDLGEGDYEFTMDTTCYWFDDNDTIEICIAATDSTHYCEDNELDICWSFLIDFDEIRESLAKPENILLTTYPNPFNSSCKITVDVGSFCETPLQVEILDLRGNVVATPINMKAQQGIAKGKESCATKSIHWCPDESISSGIYLVRATTEDGNFKTKRIVLIK